MTASLSEDDEDAYRCTSSGRTFCFEGRASEDHADAVMLAYELDVQVISLTLRHGRDTQSRSHPSSPEIHPSRVMKAPFCASTMCP